MTNKQFGQGGKLFSATAQAAGTVVSPLVFLQDVTVTLPNGRFLRFYGQSDVDKLTANFACTGQGGTSPTLTMAIQGNSNPFSNNTTTTAALTAAATTVALTERTGIAQNAMALLVSTDANQYEWVQVTSSATTGAGNHTIVRAQRGTTARAFASGAYLLFSNGWATIPSGDATTTTLTSGAVSISSAAATAPVTAVVDSEALKLETIPFPVIRLAFTVGGSSSPTATYDAFLNGRK